MLRLSELKLPLDHGEAALQEAVLQRLRIPPDLLLGQSLVQRQRGESLRLKAAASDFRVRAGMTPSGRAAAPFTCTSTL